MSNSQIRLQAPWWTLGNPAEYLGICIQTEHWQRVKLHRQFTTQVRSYPCASLSAAQKHLNGGPKPTTCPLGHREVDGVEKTTQRLNDTHPLDEPTPILG